MSNPPSISINIPDEVRALIHSDKRPIAEIARVIAGGVEQAIVEEFDGQEDADGR